MAFTFFVYHNYKLYVYLFSIVMNKFYFDDQTILSPIKIQKLKLKKDIQHR